MQCNILTERQHDLDIFHMRDSLVSCESFKVFYRLKLGMFFIMFFEYHIHLASCSYEVKSTSNECHLFEAGKVVPKIVILASRIAPSAGERL